MKKPRPLLALIPLSGSRLLTWETMQMIRQLDDLFAQAGVPFTAIRLPGYDQAHARDELLAKFLHHGTQFEDALMLDGDMSTDPRYVAALAILEEPLVCLPYEMRHADMASGGNTWAIDQAGEKIWAEIREDKRMMRVRGAGLGFTRIRRAALEQMHAKYKHDKALNWISHFEEWPGLPVTGYCTPLVTEHPDGSGIPRRRPEDMTFFARAREAGLTAYALLDVPVWHDARGGRTFLDGILDHERQIASMRKRAHFELAECPDDLLGLVDVLDGGYDIHGLELDKPRILDVGANIGAFAIWAAKRFPGAEITCYEPHPKMVQLCRDNVGTGWPKVEIVNAAVTGDGKGPVRLFDGLLNQGERTIHPIAGAHAETCTEVPAVAAETLPPCELLKVDTEGCEREILEHYPHMDGVKVLMAEWHSGADYLWIKEFARKHDMICMVDRARGRPSEHRDLCFVRKGVMVDSGTEVAA